MSTPEWRALSDDHNAAGKPLPAEPGGPWDDLWPHLSVVQQQLVASGRVTFEELLERVTAAADAELCPRCARHPVSAQYGRLGLCAPCARAAMIDAANETLAEIAAGRESAKVRQQVRRARIDAGLPLPRAKVPAAPKPSEPAGAPQSESLGAGQSAMPDAPGAATE